MKWDIAMWMVIILIGAILVSAGARGDDSNEKEVGGWSVDKYHGQAQDLEGMAAANVDQFYYQMGIHGWTKKMRWKDDWAWESDFEDYTRGGYDSWEADSVDLVYFCGHGNQFGIAFGTNSDSVKPQGSSYFTENDEVKWGDTDMEWIVLDSCHVLQYKYDDEYIWDRWDNPDGYQHHQAALTIHAGLHVMMGWDSVGVLYSGWKYGIHSRGYYFGVYITQWTIWGGNTLWTGWHDATLKAKPLWDGSTYRAAMFYGKIYKNGHEVLRYSNEKPYSGTWKDPTWYVNHGYTLKWGYSSWNV